MRIAKLLVCAGLSIAALDVAFAAQPATLPTTQPATTGGLRYKLSKNAEEAPSEIREQIVKVMDEALVIYNANGTFDRTITANYKPGTPTAEANYDGLISFGKQIAHHTALHEIGHTMGIGTHPKWRSLIKDGLWTGEHALAQLREFDGPDAKLHADRQHFWPYGLNFAKESNPEADVRHVKMVIAFRKDLGVDGTDDAK
ncbi:MAG: hypothetical protein QM770_13420 [Tepidisphaeraceae bacterium]